MENPMTNEKQKVAGYGLYFRANNQLIKKASDRVLFQAILDLVRNQLKVSIENETVSIERSKLCRMAGLEENHTGPSSLKRLSTLGLIDIVSTSEIKVNCDAYVKAVRHYEKEVGENKKRFALDFQELGVEALKKWKIKVPYGCRISLTDMVGSSMVLNNDSERTTEKIQSITENFQEGTEKLQLGTEKLQLGTEKIQSSTEKLQLTPEKIQFMFSVFAKELKKFSSTFNIPMFENGLTTEKIQLGTEKIQLGTENLQEGTEKIQLSPEKIQYPTEKIQYPTEKIQYPTEKIQEVTEKIQLGTENLQSKTEKIQVPTEKFQFTTEKIQSSEFLALKNAFETGKLDENLLFSSNFDQNLAIFTTEFFQFITEFFQFESPKTTENFQYRYNREDKPKNKRDFAPKTEERENEEKIEEGNENENFQLEIKKGLERFGKVEILNLGEEEISQPEKNIFLEAGEKVILEKAERDMKARNPYRNKPYIPVEKISMMVTGLDEVVQTPVEFFLYNFWWGLYDLYCDHYQPSSEIDEEGEVIEEPQSYNWREIIGCPLPQSEIYSLAENIYRDLEGAVEQGQYIYGDSEWTVRFAFDSFEDFNPFEMFQWSPCAMADGTPALKVADDRFYDIWAEDVHTPVKAGRQDRQEKTASNKKMVELILSSDTESLTPLESAIRAFYGTFVKLGRNNIIDEFTDAHGVPLESGGGLPDHILKPWCISQPKITYSDFTGAIPRYIPMDGVHKRSTVFSADSVVRWNEVHGFRDTVSHRALV